MAQSSSMKQRLFYFLSIVLLIVALICHVAATQTGMTIGKLNVTSIEIAQKQHTVPWHDPAVPLLRQQAKNLEGTGAVLATCGFGCMVVAAVKREKGLYSIPILLLFFDLMAALIL